MTRHNTILVTVMTVVVAFAGFTVGRLYEYNDNLSKAIAAQDRAFADTFDRVAAETLAAETLAADTTLPSLSYEVKASATSDATAQCLHHKGVRDIRWITVDSGHVQFSAVCKDNWLVGRF